MKRQNKYILIFLGLALLTVAFFAPNKPDGNHGEPQPDQPQTVELPSQSPSSNNQNTDTSNANATTTPSANQKSKQEISQTLKATPNAPQIPYYLLATTNDPYLGSSWAHTKVQTGRAWDLTTGSSSKTVAVIDTGFELSHEDLTGRWYQNNGEVGQTQAGDTCWTGVAANKSSNNCDDDQNGYIDDWRDYDFYYMDNNPQAGQVNPTGEGTQHGSMVAGVVGATANNAKGSAGIDQGAKIMPLQVFSDNGEAYTDDLVAAIDYATDMNADVINLSLGTNEYDSTLLNAINRARTNGTLVIAASGNCALNDEPICNNLAAPGRMTYPALYQSVIAVGATTTSDQRASYSSYGSQLDLVAPGSSIGPLPVYNNGQVSSYATASGTSFAAPLVAGLASILIAQNPSASLPEIEFLLTESTERPSAMNNQMFTAEYGAGRVNAHKATLLGLARTQNSRLGTVSLSPKRPANGYIWRTVTGSINNDEFILIGCRVASADVCSTTVENGSVYQFLTTNNVKGDELQYTFIKGGAVPSGTWKISVHNSAFATQVTTLTK